MNEFHKSGTNNSRKRDSLTALFQEGFVLILFFFTNITFVTAQGCLATGMLLPQQLQASKGAWAISNDWYPKWSWLSEVGQASGGGSWRDK